LLALKENYETLNTSMHTEYEERNKDNVPEPFVPPTEMKNRLAELLNEDEDDVDDAVCDQASNDEHTTSVVEAEVYAAVDHETDLPPPPPPLDDDPAFEQVTTTDFNVVDPF